MRLPFRTRWHVFVLSFFLWAAGVVGLWHITPVGPREDWQLPADEMIRGILSDDRTLVTIPRWGNPATPVRLRDIGSGRLRATHVGPHGDTFLRVCVAGTKDLLLVHERVKGTDANTESYGLRVHDAWSWKEIASFSRELPAGRTSWSSWVLSSDGRTTAFVTYEKGQPRVECREVASGLLLHQIPDCAGPLVFSPDGRRLVAVQGSSGLIFDAATGQELARLTQPNGYDPIQDLEFSPDGSLLLQRFDVFEVATGKRRFGLHAYGSAFTPDGREVAILTRLPPDDSDLRWLAYYDVATGQERVERRVPLFDDLDPGSRLRKGTPDGRWLFTEGTSAIRQPTSVERWVGKLPGFQTWGETRVSRAFVLVEAATGREIMRGAGRPVMCTSDGQYMLSLSEDLRYQLWDLPPRKPLRWLLLLAGVWSIVVFFLAWWSARLMTPSSRAPPGSR
jgi:hypothetical protein